MTNTIDLAISRAAQAAGNIPHENAGLPTRVPQNLRRLMTMDEALAGVLIIHEWLKVSEHGLQIGSKKPLLEEIPVRIDMGEIAFHTSIKYGGNPATYRKTYDNVICADGASWAQALSEARAADPKARPYRSADMQMELIEDVKLKDETVEAGTVLGHTFSTTGFKALAKLAREMRKDGADPSIDTIEVTVGYLEQNGNGNSWGILDFRDWKVVA